MYKAQLQTTPELLANWLEKTLVRDDRIRAMQPRPREYHRGGELWIIYEIVPMATDWKKIYPQDDIPLYLSIGMTLLSENPNLTEVEGHYQTLSGLPELELLGQDCLDSIWEGILQTFPGPTSLADGEVLRWAGGETATGGAYEFPDHEYTGEGEIVSKFTWSGSTANFKERMRELDLEYPEGWRVPGTDRLTLHWYDVSPDQNRARYSIRSQYTSNPDACATLETFETKPGDITVAVIDGYAPVVLAGEVLHRRPKIGRQILLAFVDTIQGVETGPETEIEWRKGKNKSGKAFSGILNPHLNVTLETLFLSISRFINGRWLDIEEDGTCWTDLKTVEIELSDDYPHLRKYAVRGSKSKSISFVHLVEILVYVEDPSRIEIEFYFDFSQEPLAIYLCDYLIQKSIILSKTRMKEGFDKPEDFQPVFKSN